MKGSCKTTYGETMLEVKNIKKCFGDFVAVDNLNFSVKPGEIYGVLGTNGAGKTTTFRMILGLLQPTEGEVLYNGKKIGYDVSNEVGYLVEERALLTKNTVEEMITFYSRLKGMEPEKINTLLDYWLKRFNLSKYKKSKIKELSKGMQQKVQFISAVINRPKLLVLDEPFSGLDPLNIQLMIDVIKELKAENCTIIFSSHRIDHVEQFCEELTVLVKGECVLSGNIEKIKDDFMKKTIHLSGKNIDVEKLQSIDGVIKVENNLNEITLSVESIDKCRNVFEYVKTLDNITKYSVEKPSLSEIFIEKVGSAYDE